MKSHLERAETPGRRHPSDPDLRDINFGRMWPIHRLTNKYLVPTPLRSLPGKQERQYRPGRARSGAQAAPQSHCAERSHRNVERQSTPCTRCILIVGAVGICGPLGAGGPASARRIHKGPSVPEMEGSSAWAPQRHRQGCERLHRQSLCHDLMHGPRSVGAAMLSARKTAPAKHQDLYMPRRGPSLVQPRRGG